jgi:DNA-directed RNA polymerase subunit RPC12/RpoP
MEHSRSILKLETEAQPSSINYMCIRCGKQFTKPIFAINNSPGVAEAYYACPSCLSKVEIKKDDKKVEPKAEAVAQHESAPAEEKIETITEPKQENQAPTPPSICAHYNGYLKNRPKNTPVPEECFTCTLMLDCMSPKL